MEGQLPAGFEDLERFVPEWIHETEAGRNAFRVSRSLVDLKEFYEILIPRLDAISARLEETTLDKLSQREATLLELAFMVMEVAPAVEYYNQPDVPHSVNVEMLKILPVGRRYTIKTEITTTEVIE